jgi:hypothetical protein
MCPYTYPFCWLSKVSNHMLYTSMSLIQSWSSGSSPYCPLVWQVPSDPAVKFVMSSERQRLWLRITNSHSFISCFLYKWDDHLKGHDSVRTRRFSGDASGNTPARQLLARWLPALSRSQVLLHSPLSIWTSRRMNIILKKLSRKNLKMYITNACVKILKIMWKNRRKLQHIIS